MKIPNNFDLRSLQVFVITADQGGMTQSAKVLRMTQSAVSQIIAGLEDAVGVKLFDRSVRPIVLTSAGRILLERGRQILRDTKEAFRETRTLERRRLASLTVAMTDSMSAVLGSHLYETMNEVSSYWRFWSGLSPYHREEFLTHNIDLIITTSDVMEDVSGLNRYKVFQEPYVLIFPKTHKGSTKLEDGERDLPFLRFSIRSAMGLRIERQLNRLRLKFPDIAEFDRAPAHTLAVAKGLGWGVTTPLCLLENPELIPHVDIQPIQRGSFSRHFDLLSREDNLGDIPEKIAIESRRILKKHCLPKLYDQVPWLEDMISLNED
ncbi:LysR family transcriptional regulator [Hellea balneolensis]|uniref:LysR family transcriptional regulator n=1 Tax=Hellea balneolensis TaxID=287478 RepID=UPI000429D898|nr:LysR family transcriptional regulator [Hellea balneolensis]